VVGDSQAHAAAWAGAACVFDAIAAVVSLSDVTSGLGQKQVLGRNGECPIQVIGLASRRASKGRACAWVASDQEIQTRRQRLWAATVLFQCRQLLTWSHMQALA